jgi:hypothetical protein
MGSSYPKCSGIYPCRFCVVDIPVPASPNNATLTCATNSKSANEMFLANWDFDTGYAHEQYILD